MPAGNRKKILWANRIKFYGFDLRQLPFEAQAEAL
jgi:hypothetical protein